MTILQRLDDYYDRMAARNEVVAPGWSVEPIGYVVALALDGRVTNVTAWNDPSNKKPRSERVPKWFGRSGTGSTPYFLWDNTAYVFGASDKGPGKTARDHAAFKRLHLEALHDIRDDGLQALVRFLQRWSPDDFAEPLFSSKMFKCNIAFALNGEQRLLQERPLVTTLVERLRAAHESQSGGGRSAMCLVRGEVLPIARLHRKIKGVEGTASAEVPLVSFEKEAFRSFGHEQGANAPTSEIATFRYSAALNALLGKGASNNRLQRTIGDATVVFWADTSATVDETAAMAAETMFFQAFEGLDDDDPQEAAKLHDALEKVAEGRPQDTHLALRPGTRFHVLGLAPNAARLSVRYWLDDRFEAFARRLLEHERDLRIEPRPHRWGHKAPSIGRLLVKTTALQEKSDNIPPLLAGEAMRAVLAGTRYPRSWLGAALIRLRAGDDPSSGWHAAVIRAVLERDRRLEDRDKGRSDVVERRTPEVPVSLDKAHPNAGYQLGRLFAIYELAQVAALGRGVKSTIRDKFFGAASATPARVFPLIVTNGQNHLSKVRKEKAGWAHLIEKELEEVMGRFEPNVPHTWPRFLRQEDQGEFAIGYYHQRRAKLGAKGADQPTLNLAGEGEGDDD